MMNYYYLAASLPMLWLESPPPLSFDQFHKLCQEHLTRGDLEALDELIEPLEKDSRHEFVLKWRDNEIQFRNALARVRAERLGRDASAYLRERKAPSITSAISGQVGSGQSFSTYVEKAVSDAYLKDNPVDRELALDKFRWNQIEEIAGYDPFSSSTILAYALKLQLSERWTKMDEAKGKEKAEEIIMQRSHI